MRVQSIFALAFAAIAAADDPIEFVVSVFEKSLTCDASTGAKTVFGNGCQDRTLPKGGSALVRISTVSKYGFVTGYSDTNCTGTPVVVFTKEDGCTQFEDVEVKSWIGKPPFSEDPTK